MASFTPELQKLSTTELSRLSFDISEELVERELQELCAELQRLETMVTPAVVGRYEIARCTPREAAYRFDSADDNWGGF